MIRRQKVMLSTHLAGLYGVETKALVQAVKRNIERFPEDFMFSLTREEILNLSQIVISSKIKHAPNVFAFTEQGVAPCYLVCLTANGGYTGQYCHHASLCEAKTGPCHP